MALAIWWANQHGYLLGHTLAELMSAVVAWTALAVATTSVQFTRNHFVVFIAVGIGWCAGLDLLHTLSFKGMNLLPIDSTNPAIQFWVAGRALQAAVLLLAPLMLWRSVSVMRLHLGFGGWTVLSVLLIATGHFPDAYIDGQGLTPFKVYTEYLIIATMGAAAVLFWHYRALMPTHLYQRLLLATLLMMAAEFAFTRYVSVEGPANLIGHLLKIYAYWFVYDALVQHTLQAPFDMLARTASRYDAVPDPTVVVAADGTIQQANQAAAQWVGQSPATLVGQSVRILLHPAQSPAEVCPVCQRLQQARTSFLITLDLPGQRTVECHAAPLHDDGPHAAWVLVLRDVSERERLSRERESLLHDLNERIKELRGLHGVANLLKSTDLNVPAKLEKLVALLPPLFRAVPTGSSLHRQQLGPCRRQPAQPLATSPPAGQHRAQRRAGRPHPHLVPGRTQQPAGHLPERRARAHRQRRSAAQRNAPAPAGRRTRRAPDLAVRHAQQHQPGGGTAAST